MKPLKRMAKPDEYTVTIGKSVYKMPDEILKSVLKTASESVPNGVYAAKKGSVVILLNEPNLSRDRFRSLTKDYNKQGFVLLHNRGVARG